MLALDQFMDANNVTLPNRSMLVGQGWQSFGGGINDLKISGNLAVASTTTSNGNFTDVGIYDGFVTTIVNLISTDLSVFIAGRALNLNNHWQLGYFNSNQWCIKEDNSGSATTRVSTTENIPSGTYILQAGFSGNIITLSINGVQKLRYEQPSVLNVPSNTKFGLVLLKASTPQSTFSSFRFDYPLTDGKAF